MSTALTDSPSKTSIPALLAEAADRTPDEIVLQEVDGEQCTYGALFRRMLVLSDALPSLGLTSSDAVAIFLPPSIVAYEVWLGCACARMIAVPLHLEYRGNMLSHALEVSRATVVVCCSSFVPHIAEIAKDLPWIKTIVVTDDGDVPDQNRFSVTTLSEVVSRGTAKRPPSWPKPRDIATTIFTSGTTGPSKGVLVPWGELMSSANLWPARRDGTDVYYSCFPMFHVTGLNPLVFAIVFGGRLVVRERFSTDRFWTDVRTYKCTMTLLLGTMASFLASQPAKSDDPDNPLETVLMVPLLADYDGFAERFGVNIIGCYGMTEIGWPLWSEQKRPPNKDAAGRKMPGFDLRIVDEDEYEVPTGEPGELLVRSDQPWMMMQGYMNNPQATADAWRNGWFHTGDVFTRDEDGNYYFRDRVKDAIRRRGENISSIEVEQEVLAYPGVASVAAIGIESETTEQDVKVFVVPATGVELSPEELFSFLCDRMPWFMTPRFIEVVDAFPLTPTGKIRKLELKSRIAGPDEWDRVKAGHRA